ncbi:MAG: signal peptidase I [Proteobacteria bacterium]|nr:signal peptidase I [Pseudomonadota bacterium]
MLSLLISSPKPPTLLRKFVLPSLGKRFFIRLAMVTLADYILFGYALIPLRIQGKSMDPTYQDGSFRFCWYLQHLFTQQGRFDIMAVRFARTGVMLLKRIIALQGETVEFREGLLYVNGNLVEEPYVQQRSDWNLPARTARLGHVYVVGDKIAGHPWTTIDLARCP